MDFIFLSAMEYNMTRQNQTKEIRKKANHKRISSHSNIAET